MIKVLMKSIREYKKPSILSAVFIALEVIIECIIPIVMAQFIDEMTGSDMNVIVKYAIILIFMALTSLLFGTLSARVAATASCGFAKNLRQDLYFKVQDFSFSDIDKFTSASLVTRLTTDVTNIQNAYQIIIRMAIRTPLMIIFCFIMSFLINVKLSLIFIAVIPIFGVVLFAIVLKVNPIFKRIFKKYDALNNSIQENIAGIRVVKSFAREDYENEKLQKESASVRDDFTRVEKIIALNNPFMMFALYSVMLLLSFFGSKMIINSAGLDFTTGEFSSLINYGVQVLISTMMLSMVFVMLVISEESAKRIAEVLVHEPTLVSPENGLKTVNDGSISFKNVSFKYSKDAKKYALKNINLDIKSGQTIGILGGTGASKTTLIQLISRLYDTTDGEVLVGGKNVKEYDLETLRNEVAVVLQKNVLFSGTIKENLRWGNKEASDEELVRVCKLAQADEFVSQLPDKYDTYIERGGTNVSGGQKQRLCIARALLKKPKILILDDSTSAVDTKTDALIRKAFLEEIPDTTKIIIAQRVSSIQDADKIIVLEGGEIVESGNHQELINNGKIYKEVFESQNKGFGGDN